WRGGAARRAGRRRRGRSGRWGCRGGWRSVSSRSRRCWGRSWTATGTAGIDRPIPDARREDRRGERHVGRGSEEKGEVGVGIVLIRSIAVGVVVPKWGIGYQSDSVKGARE